MRNEKCEMRNETDRKVERGVLSAESLGSSELEDEEREILSAELRERLLPAEEREREMATDGSNLSLNSALRISLSSSSNRTSQ